jgi:uncharacterized protein (TIGR03382 family)/uncharacterized repeat protein (TIGR01451 family)
MNSYLHLIRTAVAAALVAALAFAAPAIAQSTDISLDWTSTAPTKVSIGKTTKYAVTVANSNVIAATDVAITATIPAGATIAGVTGCDVAVPATAATNLVYFPCTVGPLDPGATADVVVSVKYSVPDPYPTVCPAADTYGAVTITASATNDTTPANNSVSAAPPLTTTADIALDITGPASLSGDGGSYTWNVTLTNKGPCAVTETEFSTSGVTSGLARTAADGVCSKLALDGVCTVGAVASGGTATASLTYTMKDLPAQILSSHQAVGVAISYGGTAYSDPISTNNKKVIPYTVTQSSGGCSSVGGAFPMGLLGVALAGLFLRRRRS